MKITVGSLFAGIGGIDMAFEQAGFDVIWANEIDKDACKTYRNNFPDVKLIENDIKNINPLDLEKVDIITAGFPCQPFSVCGQKKGFSDPRGNLFFDITRFADALNPEIIFLENVANLINHDSGKTFNVIHNELSNRNYYVRYLVADACDYGLPQHRTRVYIIAFKDINKCNSFRFPEPIKLEKHIFDIIDKSLDVDNRYYLEVGSYKYNKMLQAIKDENQIYRFSDYGVQSSKEGVSFTLKANMGTWYDRVPIIKDNYGIRKITPYEALALYGFPKEFKFPKIPISSAYKQCGNTVCVPIIKEIAKRIQFV